MSADSTNAVSRRTAPAGLTALFLEACSRFSFFAANAPAAFGSYKRYTNIAYGPEPQHRLDVYVPSKPMQAPRPMVVFWHGGRWRYGDKSDYRFVGAALAESGCLVAVANYRHYPRVKMPGFMNDAARAAQWASIHAAEYGGDPQRLYLMGHSAGAHLAALVTLDQRYFAALGPRIPHIAGVIGLSGPYDFLPLTDADQQDMFGPPELYPQSQPINFVHADAPPMLLIQGLRDQTVKPKNSRNLAAALQALKVPVTLKLYPKASHSDTVAALTAILRRRETTLSDIQTFMLTGK
jgi:acetyl esterase/lipase